MKSCPASRFELANPLCLSAIPLGAVACCGCSIPTWPTGLGRGEGLWLQYLWFIPAEGKVSLPLNRRKSPEHNITIIHFLWTRCRGIPKHGEELLAGHALSIRTYLKHQKYKWNLISHDPNIYIEAVTRTFGPTGGFPGDRVEILVLTVHWLAAKGPNIQFLQTALYCISWPTQKSQRQCKRIFQEARTRNMFRPGCITIITIIVSRAAMKIEQ
jgi:hypothetical protein